MIETLYENKSFNYEELDNVEYNVRRLSANDYDQLNVNVDEDAEEESTTRLMFGDVSLKEKM